MWIFSWSADDRLGTAIYRRTQGISYQLWCMRLCSLVSAGALSMVHQTTSDFMPVLHTFLFWCWYSSSTCGVTWAINAILANGHSLSASQEPQPKHCLQFHTIFANPRNTRLNDKRHYVWKYCPLLVEPLRGKCNVHCLAGVFAVTTLSICVTW